MILNIQGTQQTPLLCCAITNYEKKDTRPIVNASIILFAIKKIQESQHALCKLAASILTNGLTSQINDKSIEIKIIENDLTLLETIASKRKDVKSRLDIDFDIDSIFGSRISCQII